MTRTSSTFLSISGGIHKGRRLSAPPRGVRPTSSKVREALFSLLNHHAGWGDVADRSVFFDVCAGSGIVGLEAMSRGAGRVVFVDSDGRSLKYVVDNLKILSPEEHARTFVFRGTAERFLRGGGMILPKDFLSEERIFFFDPPYAVDPFEILAPLTVSSLWSAGSVVALETSGKRELEKLPAFLAVVTCKDYKDTKLWILKYEP